MSPIPLILSRALAAPQRRGSRLAAAHVPRNMRAAAEASEARAWAHSALAGILWEAGERAARAAKIAEEFSCAVSPAVIESLRSLQEQPAGRIPGNLKTLNPMKITTPAEIKAAFSKFQPTPAGAYPTSRCLPGQYAQANQQEWAELGTIDGKPATVFYLFENSESEVEDGADMPFDVDHITHIELEEEEAPTLAQLRAMPLSEVRDFEGKESPRIGSSNAVQYKIADCSDDYASRAIVIDWHGGEGSGSSLGSRQIIRSCDAQWDQFLHRGC